MIASFRHAALPGWRRGLAGLAVIGLAMAAAPHPAAAQSIKTVETGGYGVLTLCRSWLLFRTCHHYHHVAVPARLVLGGAIDLVFGSNTKQMRYPVARIARDGAHCMVFDAADDGSVKVDKLDVAPCRLAAPEAASMR